MTDWRVICADALEGLRSLEDESVQCVVTSPPYWGLRDYGTAEWEGGDPGCDHRHDTKHQSQGGPTSARQGRSNLEAQRNENFRNICPKCGAKRVDKQLGLEPTPNEYVTRLVEIFREVRRVLRDDGTMWLVIGDTFATGAGSVGDHPGGGKQGKNWKGEGTPPNRMPIPGLKPKDLCMIPARVALALQADGWWIRMDNVWAKPNPMIESVTDRPTKAHEFVFLLSKRRRYYYNAKAIAEPVVYGDHPREGCPGPDVQAPGQKVQKGITRRRRSGNKEEDPWVTRNKRSVWTVQTEPYPGAHFATYPTKLVEPCVLAGSMERSVVLDPFCGSGTTGVVALRHGRNFIGIDLNPEYCEMARRRIEQDAPLFNRTEVEP